MAKAMRLGVNQIQMQDLNLLANEAAEAQTKEHNGDGTRMDATIAIATFEGYAKRIGFQSVWPGLYPILVKDGIQYPVDWD
jgi:hypothetical protein